MIVQPNYEDGSDDERGFGDRFVIALRLSPGCPSQESNLVLDLRKIGFVSITLQGLFVFKQ